MMVKIRLNENGYSLIITVMMTVIISVLDLSLVTITLNGLSKNTNREESINSLNQAEKAQDYLVNQINKNLSTGLNAGILRNDFINNLTNVTTNNGTPCVYKENGIYKSISKANIANKTYESMACIENVLPVYDDKGKVNDLKKKLEIVSIGTVNGKKETLKTSIEIGAGGVPEQLKYALTSNGDLTLNGAIQIQGDIRLGGALSTTTTALKVVTTKPSIIQTSTRNPRIVYSNTQPITDKFTQTEQSNFDYSVFSTKPAISSTAVKITTLDIIGKASAYAFNLTNANGLVTTGTVASRNYNGDQYLKSCSSCKTSPSDAYLSGTYTFNRLATSGDLTIQNTSKVTLVDSLTTKGSMYVGKNLTISGNVDLNGSIYVNGNLEINGANLKSNALIYVKGNVTITQSTINSLEYTDANGNLQKGTFVVFSNDSLSMKFNSSNSDIPSIINGFIYSNSSINIYGVISHLRFQGGLAGNSITLHATRGSTPISKTGAYTVSSGDGYHLSQLLQSELTDVSSDPNKNDTYNRCGAVKCYKQFSRFQIIYNEDIIKTFLSLNREEIITELDIPKTVGR